jgi:hypothetical protein
MTLFAQQHLDHLTERQVQAQQHPHTGHVQVQPRTTSCPSAVPSLPPGGAARPSSHEARA